MKYFFDNCVSPKVIDILRLAGAEDNGDEFVHIMHVDGLSRDDADVKWIPLVAAREWVAITVDHRIKSRPHERAALDEARMRVVFLPKGYVDLSRWDQTCFILNNWRAIAKEASRCRAGDRFIVRMNGKVERDGQGRK